MFAEFGTTEYELCDKFGELESKVGELESEVDDLTMLIYHLNDKIKELD